MVAPTSRHILYYCVPRMSVGRLVGWFAWSPAFGRAMRRLWGSFVNRVIESTTAAAADTTLPRFADAIHPSTSATIKKLLFLTTRATSIQFDPR